jgi:hypothetical protein
MLRRFADDIEVSLQAAIDRTVRDFFVLRLPGGSQEPMAKPEASGAPVGFRQLGCVSNAGWFNMMKTGNILHGSLEGMFERKDDLRLEKVSNFFQIKISQPCEVRLGTGEAARLVEAKAGDTINLNYGPRMKLLEPLIPLLAQGAEFEVWGTVLGDKIKLPGGRSMANFELFCKPTKAPVDDDEPGFDDDGDKATAKSSG